jgi:hypothetical protein
MKDHEFFEKVLPVVMTIICGPRAGVSNPDGAAIGISVTAAKQRAGIETKRGRKRSLGCEGYFSTPAPLVAFSFVSCYWYLFLLHPR